MFLRGIRVTLRVLEGIVFGLFLALSLPILWGLRPYIVMSGSMEPTLPVGSLIYVKETKSVGQGDLIAFRMGNGETCIHRCTAVNEDGTYATKGDANSVLDALPVRNDQIVGREVFTLPLAGYGAAFLRTPYGIAVIALTVMGGMVLELLVWFGGQRDREKAG